MDTELRPEIKSFLHSYNSRPEPPRWTVSIESARKQTSAIVGGGDEPNDLQRVQDVSIPGEGAPIPIRIYTPKGEGTFPIMLWFHGGGWVVGGLDLQDTVCRTIAREVGCMVVSVGYRLAPEHRFPAAVTDCFRATTWVAENCREIGGDGGDLIVAGSSAGGNLGAAVARLCRDRNVEYVGYQVLLYPITDHSMDTESYDRFSTGYFLTRADMERYWDLYLRHDIDGSNPFASPLHSRSLSELPAATVVTAGFDPLRDEGIAYAERLKSAGNNVTHRHYGDMIHGFITHILSSTNDVDIPDQVIEPIIHDVQEYIDER